MSDKPKGWEDYKLDAHKLEANTFVHIKDAYPLKVSTESVHTIDVPMILTGQHPKQGSEYAAGSDLYTSTDLVLEPMGTEKVGTGVKLAIPVGFCGLVMPRSSCGNDDIRVGLANTIGLIDSDYRGEILLNVENREPIRKLIPKGTRLTQLLLVPYIKPNFIEVESLDETTRGEQGFGHSGKN